MERTIQTRKRKLGTEAFSPLYKCLDLDLYILLNDLRKSKHATLNKWPFELNFGRKSNTELSLARDKILKNSSNQTTHARSLLEPEDRHSQD